MSTLIVVTGPPGAGKSTVARALSGRFERSALVVGDDVFAFLDQGCREPWTAEAHEQNAVVVGAAAAAAGRFVRGGYDTVYDGVVGPWFLDDFLAATGLAALHYAVLLPPAEVCLRRVAERAGHEFTDPDATRHMHRQFAEADVAPRSLLDTEGSPDVLAATIHEAVLAGTLRHARGTAA